MPVSARGRRTRAKLVESGREALAERGAVATRVDDVVRRAGTSHGTFYLYFDNIEDMRSVVIDECDAQCLALVSSLRDAPAGDVDAVVPVVDKFRRLYDHYGEIASPWIQPSGPHKARLQTLTEQLGRGWERSLAVLALIDRVVPQLGDQDDQTVASRRVAEMITPLLPAPAPPTAPAPV